MRTIVAVLLALSAFAIHAPGEIIYQENFDSYQQPTPLAKLGWRVVTKPGCSDYVVQEGKLHVTITPHAGQDGYAEIEVPVCRRGQIDFDVLIDPENRKAQGIGLTLDLYNISTFWHDYCQDWRLYFPEPTAKRMNDFNVEPVGHQSIGRVEKHQWIHYRICFDTDRDRVECYLGGLDDPAYIKGDAAVLGRAEYQDGKLRIGSFGICSGPYQAVVDNIVIRSLDGESAGGKAERDLFLLFRGMSFEQYRIGPALASAGIDAARVRNYDLDFWRSSYMAENTFKYAKLPSAETFARAKAIVLIDAPRCPNDILPDFILKDMAQNVHDGARLVVLGGLFSLDKGGYRNSVLERILPVKIENPWQVGGAADKPLIIQPVAGKFQPLDWQGKPSVYSYHDLKLTDNAEVMLKAGDRPLLVRRKFGQGEVLVFLGTVCGPAAANQPAFWRWTHWPKLASLIVTGE